MVDDPFPGYGLRPVELADRPTFDAHLASLAQPLSDYTFSQIFTWRNSLRLIWKPIRGHLCVFANGTGDLTLLLPPVGDGGGDAALAEAFELMDDYNTAHRLPTATASRVEYASDELLARFDRGRLDVVPMGTDYVYDVQRMIDLAGGDLKSKRQERNRFTRDVAHRAETYDPARHFDACRALLAEWRTHQDAKHLSEAGIDSLKRHKESIATDLALEHAAELGLTGMVVYVTDPATGAEAVRGFTFGEPLGTDQSSIVIEKTDLQVKGLAQFIFSEFCRVHWSHRPRVNAGDDWGLENLKWTKTSYRPIALLPKYGFRRTAVASAACGVAIEQPSAAASEAATEHPPQPVPATPQAAVVAPHAEPVIRAARKTDLPAAEALENNSFDTYRLGARQLKHLQSSSTAVFLVAEDEGRIVGEAIGLLRHHRGGSMTGRAYSLAVDPGHRGRGIGRRLMAATVEALVARGARKIYLEVEASNAPAIALYEHMGFHRLSDLPDYYGPGRPGVHMVHEVPATALAPAA